MLCYTHACNFTLPVLPVAGGFCGMMIFPPCPHALHGREPSCIMRWNVHICSLYKAGHSRGARGPFARTYRSFPVPHAFFMPLLAVCQGVHRLAVLARFARWIPDTPDAVDDCIESGANGGGTPGGGPPTTRPAL